MSPPPLAKEESGRLTNAMIQFARAQGLDPQVIEAFVRALPALKAICV